MDAKAYEKAKNYIREMIRMEPPVMEPPAGVNVLEWVQKMTEARRPEIERLHALAMEPRTWSVEEQDAFAEIAASPDEPASDRQHAMGAISICKITRHADLMAALLEDPRTDPNVRGRAAWTLGQLGIKELLPLVYRVAMSVKVPAESYTASLHDTCIRAMFWIAARHKFIDGDKYRTRPYNNVSMMCKRWWDEMQPTETMILAWSRGEHPS